MQPLRLRTRRIYLTFLILVFIAALPFIILYSSGYNFTKDFSIVETGGIFIGLEGAGAVVYMNNEELGRSSLLTRSIFRQNLKAGIYNISVERDGYYPWQKVLTVEPSYVSDARAIFIPQELQKTELVLSTLKPKGATTTPGTDYVAKNDLTAYTTLFTPATTSATATLAATVSATATPVAESGPIGLFIDKGNLTAKFDGATSTAPSNFCLTPTRCVGSVPIEKGSETVKNADFLFGNRSIAIYTTESGVYVAEIDIRSPKLLVPIYQVRGADFRLDGNELIIKDGKKYYRLDGF